MTGSNGDGEGTIYLAHVWVPEEHHKDTVGPWHWWNVYKDHVTAHQQAARVAAPGGGWKNFALAEVLVVEGARK